MLYQKVQGFRVYETWSYQTNIAPNISIDTPYVSLESGLLTPKRGFCFEPSGPTFKTKNFMRPSCLHDAGYFLMCHGYLDSKWKGEVDNLMYEVCREDGMSQLRAGWCYGAVDKFGDSSIEKSNRMKVLSAP